MKIDSLPPEDGASKSIPKNPILGLIYATQFLRVPLILLNLFAIVVKLVSGLFSSCSKEKIRHGVDAVKGNGEGTRENTGNFFTTTKYKVSEAAQATKDKVTGVGQATKDKTADNTQAVKDKVSGGDAHN